MSRKTDLEANICASYDLIRQFEEIIRLSDNPKERARSEHAIKEQRLLVNKYFEEYESLCRYLRVPVSEEFSQLAFGALEKSPGSEITSSLPKTYCESDFAPLRLFYSYSHKDELLRNELAKHLKLLERSGLITSWHDRRISAGTEWKNQIDKNLEEADIILLIVSPDFMVSDYCYDVELQRALERHQEQSARVIPIVARTVNWQLAPFGKLQALPTDAKPVDAWKNRDAAWANVEAGIRAVITEIRKIQRASNDSESS
jgi:TIR domain-containing protein